MRKDLFMIIFTGFIVGIAALVLVSLGNPPNMGFCVACFERDIAGALGLHDFQATAWIRPEILGILFGAFLAALFTGEFRPESGSSPLTRFVLGMFVMIGALAFLGCPLRMILRLGGGDLNALVALAGFAAGIWVGVIFLKRGFNLGKAYRQRNIESLALPIVMVGLLLLLVFLPSFREGGPVFVGAKGHPGVAGTPVSQGTGIWISLCVSLLVGVLAQRSRLCLAGGVRDLILMRSGLLLSGFLSIFAVVLIGNILLGRFHPGFAGQPVAHTAFAWNFLGMSLVGLASVLLGGCPLRQLVLAGNGNADSALTIAGMFAGAAFAHNFGLVKAASIYGKGAVILGLVAAIAVALANREE